MPESVPPDSHSSEQDTKADSWHDLVEVSDDDGETGMEQSLRGARQVESTALAMVRDAQQRKLDSSEISARMRNYNEALANRAKIEKLFRLELLERRQLWPVAECKAQTSALVRLVLARLDSLPSSVGPQANQQDPHHSTAVLTRAVSDIRKELLRSLQAFEE